MASKFDLDFDESSGILRNVELKKKSEGSCIYVGRNAARSCY